MVWGAIFCALASIQARDNELHTLGNEKPSFCARRTPSFHSPPPTLAPCLLTQLPGLPMISQTRQTWSTSFPPGNKGFSVAISTAMAPTAQMSTGAEYSPALNKTSGALYHLVETYVVYGSFECVSRARPKSAILMEYAGGVEGGVTRAEYLLKAVLMSCGAEVETRMFSGLISRWKKRCSWMCSRPDMIWNRILFTLAPSSCL